MRGDSEFHPDLSMDEIMSRWPETIHILIKYKMHCLGCALAPYHSATDAAFEHEINEQGFMKDLTEISRPKL